MIFQAPIDLEVKDRSVAAIIDLETGFIGFTETKNDIEIEYYFRESPVEFKKALLNRLEPLFGETIKTNFKICRKNENMKYINKYLSENSKSR